MTTEVETKKRVIPEALGNEDGDSWILVGHVDPPLAVLAVVLEQMVNYGPQEAFDLLTGGATNYSNNGTRRTLDDVQHDADDLVESVTHVWMRENPEDDDLLLRCNEGDEGAEPWTVVSS